MSELNNDDFLFMNAMFLPFPVEHELTNIIEQCVNPRAAIKNKKCQKAKLNAKFKKLKRDVLLQSNITGEVNTNVGLLSANVEVHYRSHEEELAYLRIISHRCLMSLQHLAMNTVFHIPLSGEGHNELSQLVSDC